MRFVDALCNDIQGLLYLLCFGQMSSRRLNEFNASELVIFGDINMRMRVDAVCLISITAVYVEL